MQAQQLLQTAVQALQQGRPDKASQLALQLLQQVKEQPDALHLLAVCARQQGQLEQALQYFRRSLNASPDQSAVWSNYGNTLQQLEQFAAAEQAYQRALQLAPQQADSWLNAGLLSLRRQQPEQALPRLQRALQLRPDDRRCYPALATALQQTEQPAAAMQLLQQALQRWPDEFSLHWQQALLLRENQQPAAAMAILSRLLLQAPQQAGLHFMLGCVHHDLQQEQAAEQALLRAIELDPLHIGAHEALNQLYWERKDQQLFLQHSLHILQQQPDALSLRYCLLALLLQAGREQDAEQLLQQGLQRHGPLPELLHAQGVQAAKRGDLATASALTQQALRSEAIPPQLRVRALLDAASYAMHQQQLPAALNLLEQAQQLSPQDQEVWAYLGTCWRLLGDPRHAWLNNYSQLIDARPLPTPAGFASLADFLAELNPLIHSLHTSQRQPLDQSVRGGTQTLGQLLASPHPLIQKLKAALEARVQEYLQRLPADATHPLLARNHQQFRFAGSWSVRLGNQGFHTNHVHPQGWLSACLYLQLPDCIKPDDPGRQGWLKLGETSMRLGEQEQVAQAICPQPGLLVLFPSFIWHGTYPLQDAGNSCRLTLPCDIMPL